MVRLLGVDLSKKKKLYIALTAIYGIGVTTSLKMLVQVGIDPNKKVSDLSDSEINSLRTILETDDYQLEGDLRRMINLNVKRLIDISCYRGRRHIKGLPVRGQRSRTNSRTCRNIRVYAAGKKRN